MLTGRSGSGKTGQARHLLQYMASAAGSVDGLLGADKLNAIFGLLEAFGNARTPANPNASRFATLATLDFDHVSQVSAGLFQGLLLESRRVVQSGKDRCTDGEANFHVFYYLWEGLDGEDRRRYGIQGLDPSATFVPLQKPDDRETARTGWAKLNLCLDALERLEQRKESRASAVTSSARSWPERPLSFSASPWKTCRTPSSCPSTATLPHLRPRLPDPLDEQSPSRASELRWRRCL